MAERNDIANTTTGDFSRADAQVAAKLLWRIGLPFMGVVLLVCALGDFVVSRYYVSEAKLSNAYKVHKLTKAEIGADEIPIFGASMARNAFFADSLGPDFYNYGMENAGFIINEQLIQLELAKSKNAPLILDFHWRGMELDSLGSSINLMTFLPFVREQDSLRSFLKRNGRYRAHQSVPGLRYFGAYTTYFKDWLANSYQPRKYYSRGGVYNRETPPQEQMDRLIELRRLQGPKQFAYDSLAEQRFSRLFEAAPDRAFLLVSSPRHHSVMEMLEDYEAMKAWGLKMQRKHPNLRVLLFDCDYPDRYFKDTGHLSLEGAQVYSGQLRRAFEALGYFAGGSFAVPVSEVAADALPIFSVGADHTAIELSYRY